jgi:hypothetical protein
VRQYALKSPRLIHTVSTSANRYLLVNSAVATEGWRKKASFPFGGDYVRQYRARTAMTSSCARGRHGIMDDEADRIVQYATPSHEVFTQSSNYTVKFDKINAVEHGLWEEAVQLSSVSTPWTMFYSYLVQ